MSQDIPTKSDNIKLATEQVSKTTPQSIINAIAIQMDRLDESKKRIDDEGIVVRDLKGSVIPHPAIKIEADATKLMSELISRNKKQETGANLLSWDKDLDIVDK